MVNLNAFKLSKGQMNIISGGKSEVCEFKHTYLFIRFGILFFLIILISRSSYLYAQNDSVKLSITYEMRYQNYENDDTLSKDLTKLDIGVYSSRFYSLVLEWYKQNPEGHDPYIGTKPRNENVYKNMPNIGTITFIHMPYWLTTQDSICNLFNWQLADGDSIVCEYPCKKATVSHRGRTWIVWYTLDIPYSDGPWKFCGLPGLILHAKDSEGKFIFDCIGIERGDGHMFYYPTYKNKRVVTPERAEELLLMEAEDNDSYAQLMFPQAKIVSRYDANGHAYKWQTKTAVPYEIFPENHKKKNPQKKKSKKKR